MTDREIRIEYTDCVEIKRWPRNPKDHDVYEIKKSMNRFGFVVPVVFDETTETLVAGHGRLDTLEFMMRKGEDPPIGIKAEEGKWLVPVVRGVAFDNPAEAESYLLADNRLSEIGGWKQDILDTMLAEMADVDELLNGTGFDIADALSREERLELHDMDENVSGKLLPDACQEIWQVEHGQIWSVGRHHVMCADATDPEATNLLLQGKKMTGIVTSPPYAEKRSKQYGGIPEADYVEWFYEVQKNLYDVLLPTGHFFLNIKPHTVEKGERIHQRALYVNELVLKMAKEWGWCFIDEYSWPHMVPPRKVIKKFRNSWEPIYWFTKTTSYIWYPNEVKGKSDTAVHTREESWGAWDRVQGKKRIFVPRAQSGDTYPSNVLYLGMVKDSRHPAQFPERLPSFFMQACSLELESWYDPFCGSGTTLFAAEEFNRIGYGMELVPEFVALVLQLATEKGLPVGRREDGN